MDTPIFDALWAKYNATPIFDQLEREYQEKKYLELVEPYKYPLNSQRVFDVNEFVAMMTQNHILTITEIGELFGFKPIKEKPLMNTWQRLVEEFRNAMDLPVSEIPRTLSPEESALHIKMIRKEFEEEFVPAWENQDLVEMYDSGIDVIVYIIGALSHAGFDIDPGFKEVMRNNMSKLDPETGKPIRSRGEELDGEPVGKILKPEGYQPVNLHPIINEMFQFGHEDNTVYNAKDLPLTFGEGGPVIGSANLRMDHNGRIDILGTINDTDRLPHLEAVSLSDVYIPEDDPVEIVEDRELNLLPHEEDGVVAEPQQQDWRI